METLEDIEHLLEDSSEEEVEEEESGEEVDEESEGEEEEEGKEVEAVLEPLECEVTFEGSPLHEFLESLDDAELLGYHNVERMEVEETHEEDRIGGEQDSGSEEQVQRRVVVTLGELVAPLELGDRVVGEGLDVLARQLRGVREVVGGEEGEGVVQWVYMVYAAMVVLVVGLAFVLPAVLVQVVAAMCVLVAFNVHSQLRVVRRLRQLAVDVVEMRATASAFEVAVQKAIRFITDCELVARGYRLSAARGPIARMDHKSSQRHNTGCRVAIMSALKNQAAHWSLAATCVENFASCPPLMLPGPSLSPLEGGDEAHPPSIQDLWAAFHELQDLRLQCAERMAAQCVLDVSHKHGNVALEWPAHLFTTFANGLVLPRVARLGQLVRTLEDGVAACQRVAQVDTAALTAAVKQRANLRPLPSTASEVDRSVSQLQHRLRSAMVRLLLVEADPNALVYDSVYVHSALEDCMNGWKAMHRAVEKTVKRPAPAEPEPVETAERAPPLPELDEAQPDIGVFHGAGLEASERRRVDEDVTPDHAAVMNTTQVVSELKTILQNRLRAGGAEDATALVALDALSALAEEVEASGSQVVEPEPVARRSGGFYQAYVPEEQDVDDDGGDELPSGMVNAAMAAVAAAAAARRFQQASGHEEEQFGSGA